MSIRVTCPTCEESLKVADETAGKRVRCLCGATLRVPTLRADSSMNTGQRRRLLVEAPLPEIIQELTRRGLHGVLSLIDMHEFDVSNLADFAEANEQLTRGLECHLTESLSEDQRENLLTALAAGIARLADPTAAEESDSYYEPFGLKGDELGMTLGEFKQKHFRQIPGSNLTAPFCSNVSGGFRVAELHTEPWHAAAKIVHARLDYPAENCSPTLAGVATDLVLYQFLEGCLYQIVALFGTEDYPQVAESLRRRYGAPSEESQQTNTVTWRRLHSTMQLTKGRMSPREPARLRLFVDEALAEASHRERQFGADI